VKPITDFMKLRLCKSALRLFPASVANRTMFYAYSYVTFRTS